MRWGGIRWGMRQGGVRWESEVGRRGEVGE